MLPLNKARLNILRSPALPGIGPEILLFLKSKCIKFDKLVNEDGILPDNWLSATFKTVRRFNLPISAGISPESLLPIKSRMRRNVRLVMHLGISPVIPFQSAIVRLERRVSLHISGEIKPVIKPVR
ncbi:hypothetical protein ES332_D05G075800v1 [Gossypium tomentosum]|uniref:Uncharacterized protein n=1 Tax=Gossypium tomentosum TaxID=34277 RepID=A0A5D2KSY4_GOSTO|nr:hypothetical protein ES332_D05G075800v1 [Gossypium tomentosum]